MKQHTAVLRQIIFILLAPLLCLPLSACRESPTLHEVRYEQAAPEVDQEQEMLDPEEEGEEDERFDEEQDDSAETERDSEEDMGLNDPAQPDAGSSVEVDYSPSADNEWQSQDTPAEPVQDQTGAEASGKSNDPAETAVIPDTVPDDKMAEKQIVDSSGRTVTLPENVETVTAVRWAAQMVEMLGGSGRLVAADSDFLSSPLAKAAFSDLSGVSCLWSGSGSNGMTIDQFSALLALEPDVCFEISGEHTFSSGQLRQLEEAGIAYVVLPSLKNTDTLKQAVSLIAEILDTNSNTGKNAASIAASYSAWVDGVIGDVKGKLDYTSLYIAEWDSSASYVLSHTKGVIDSTGSGLAIAYSPKRSAHS